jgi:formylglycine-generating enzyme
MLRRVILTFAVAALAALPLAAKAQSVFNMPSGDTSLSFVTVGNPGNTGNPASSGGSVGAVGYTYQIGTYDVTIGQYTQFLNAVAATDQFVCYPGLGSFAFGGIAQTGVAGSYSYSITGGSQAANMPITNVTYADAIRFVNWLDNGQPTSGTEGAGTTESGAYSLSGYIANPQNGSQINTDKSLLANLAKPPHSGSGAPQYFLPTSNEWYKAAYYDASAGTYWAYPTQSNTAPDNTLSLATSESNDANYTPTGGTLSDPTNLLTPVGTFVLSPGPYGTYDMAGDAQQWTETPRSGLASILLDGGGYDENSNYFWTLQTSTIYSSSPVTSANDLGFRIAASVAVPEPSTIALVIAGAVGLLVARMLRSNRSPAHCNTVNHAAHSACSSRPSLMLFTGGSCGTLNPEFRLGQSWPTRGIAREIQSDYTGNTLRRCA